MSIERDSSPRLHSRGSNERIVSAIVDPVQCRVLLERIQCLIQAEANLIIEVTLAGRGFRRIIHQLKNSRYTVTIVFLFLKSPDVCIARVRNRVMAGGHDVPEEDIIRRFYRSKQNFWGFYKDLVNEWGLFYNSGDSIQQVAARRK